MSLESLTSGRPRPESPLFASRTERAINPSNVLNRHLWPACDRLGVLRCGFHAFRRGIATAQVLAGTDPKTMQTWLGHKDVQTTLNHCAMANANKLRGAVEAWGEKLRAADAANLSTKPPKLSAGEYQLAKSQNRPALKYNKTNGFERAPVAQKDRAAVS
ncbi:MAG: tyrosine-type recombinase/integrase [Candidatus Acidiferrales bacterium]